MAVLRLTRVVLARTLSSHDTAGNFIGIGLDFFVHRYSSHEALEADVFYSPCRGFAQSQRFQYLTAQAEVLQSGVQMPQWIPLQ